MNNDLVWYACYGSNMLEERFMCYIQGGICRFNNGSYSGCSDKTPPLKSLPVIIPYRMYFAKASLRWENKGVAFLDSNMSGYTLGRMYLITKEQFLEVQQQEGPAWYGKKLLLGEKDGYDIVTFTNHCTLEENAPGQNYMNVLKLGMAETYPLLQQYEI